jgi:DNA-binding SARP family transcriptional activator/pimeloyl-ACP methyl ester carboxylesterase
VHIEVRVLGGFAVVIDGQEVPAARWTRRHAAALVKLLALAPDRQLHREQVFETLWPGVDAESAAARLHKAAHFARRALCVEDGVVLAREMVALFPDADVTVDAIEFESAVRAGMHTAALALYAGELLPEDRYAEWAYLPRERLQLRYRELLRATQRWDELVALDPTDEEAHVRIMQRLVDLGDRAGARRQFEMLERVLRDELGIGTSAEALAVRDRADDTPLPAAAQPRHSDLATQSIRFCTTPDGVRLAYAVSGDGAPLVKASNWLTHIDYDWVSPVWRHWWQALSNRYQLVRYDERGCGLSDWDVDDFTLDAYVRDLEAVVDTLGLESFPLLGISQGGAIAIRYASLHPERVSRLVLYGTGAQGRRARARSREDLEAIDALRELMRVSWGTNSPLFHTLYNGMFMPDAPIEQWQAFDELQKKTASAENAVRLWDSFLRADVVTEATSLQVPTLILHSRHELLRPFADAERLAHLISGSRLVPLDSNNHILQAQEAAFETFLDEVDRFLAE